jgi:hypothetical protein
VITRSWSRSAVRVRSSALYFLAICMGNCELQRGIGAKGEADLLQPTEEALLIEWSRDGRSFDSTYQPDPIVLI